MAIKHEGRTIIAFRQSDFKGPMGKDIWDTLMTMASEEGHTITPESMIHCEIKVINVTD